jgi:protein-S-isoprenylcysteine O-methyltransferase Ste14
VRHPLRRKNASRRLLPLYAAALGVFAFARPTPGGIVAGGCLIAAGLSLRAWGAGHLVKTDRLTVSGPYAHLRHPLYLGALLLAAGFLVVAGGGALLPGLACLLPAFFLYYLPYKDRIESARLERRFGPAFADYRAAVRSLRPRLSRWQAPPDLAAAGARRWSAERYRANHEAGTLFTATCAFLLLALRPVLLP